MEPSALCSSAPKVFSALLHTYVTQGRTSMLFLWNDWLRNLLRFRAELRQADLITNEECETLKVYRWQWGDLSDLVRVQCVKSPAVMAKSADVLRRYGFESNLLAVLAELRQADLITSEECWKMQDMNKLVRVQQNKSPRVVTETAGVLRRCGFVEESRLLTDCLPYHCDKAEVKHLVNEEWSWLISDYCKLKKSVRAVVKRLPKQARHLFRHVFKAASQLCKSRKPRAAMILDARELRQQIEDLHDPELLKQLSSYEEGSLKSFIVTFLDQCKENGVQPSSSQPDVSLSPSTPADQLLGFILSRKDYYITDLHINREHFSPWDVDTPPPATAPPTLDGLSHHLDVLLTSYSTLFTKVVENVETLSQQQYRSLRHYFKGQAHTGVHLPSSHDEEYDFLYDTPLFAPLCTALLRKVVKFLFTDDANNLSHQLRDYEKKLSTFVRQFLLACRREGVVTSTGGVSLDEDGCDQSDPTHLLTCVLALKAYYVVSLCVDESLFTSLQTEVDLEGEGREENVSMDASPLSPTPPTSESESPGSSIPSQFKGKGKHRVGTSPSAVPAKRSPQGDDNDEEEEEVTAGSAAKRRREGSHMTSHMTSHITGSSQSGTVTGSGGSDAILSQMVYDRTDHLKLFRRHVSRTAAGKGRAVLEGVELDTATITACIKGNPLDEEEAIQSGLTKWSGGQGLQPPTWEVLLDAMEYAQIPQQHNNDLKTALGLH